MYINPRNKNSLFHKYVSSQSHIEINFIFFQNASLHASNAPYQDFICNNNSCRSFQWNAWLASDHRFNLEILREEFFASKYNQLLPSRHISLPACSVAFPELPSASSPAVHHRRSKANSPPRLWDLPVCRPLRSVPLLRFSKMYIPDVGRRARFLVLQYFLLTCIVLVPQRPLRRARNTGTHCRVSVSATGIIGVYVGGLRDHLLYLL